MPLCVNRLSPFTCRNASAVETAKDDDEIVAKLCGVITGKPSTYVDTVQQSKTILDYPEHSTRSCRSFMSNNSGISTRSSPWYMRNIRTSYFLSNDDEDVDDDDRTSLHRNPTMPIDEEEGEYFLTSTENDDSETEEYYIYDQRSTDDENGTNNDVTYEEIQVPVEPLETPPFLGTNIQLVRPNDIRNTLSDTDTLFKNSALIGLFYAKASECQQITEYVHLFTAGYNSNNINDQENELQALPIIFCNAENDDEAIVPEYLPSYWWTINKSNESESNVQQWKSHIIEDLNIFDGFGPMLVIVDPISGNIVCSNAIIDIMELNRNDCDQYDNDACQLYDSWLNKSTECSTTNRNNEIIYEQVIENEIIIGYMDGEGNPYERTLLYSV